MEINLPPWAVRRISVPWLAMPAFAAVTLESTVDGGKRGVAFAAGCRVGEGLGRVSQTQQMLQVEITSSFKGKPKAT